MVWTSRRRRAQISQEIPRKLTRHQTQFHVELIPAFFPAPHQRRKPQNGGYDQVVWWSFHKPTPGPGPGRHEGGDTGAQQTDEGVGGQCLQHEGVQWLVAWVSGLLRGDQAPYEIKTLCTGDIRQTCLMLSLIMFTRATSSATSATSRQGLWTTQGTWSTKSFATPAEWFTLADPPFWRTSSVWRMVIRTPVWYEWVTLN